MQESAIEISRENKEKLVTLLNARLADGIDVMFAAKQAHWNVQGPAFYALHGLFDSVYEDLAEHVDIIAERAVQLDGEARGDVRDVAGTSQISRYPRGTTDGAAHLAAVSEALSKFAGLVGETARTAATLGDLHTADICAGVNRDLEKHLTFLHNHIGGAEEAGA
jgi:starvation-inducible DNA-binding protein